MDGSIHIVCKDREVLVTAIKELPAKPGLLIESNRTLNRIGNTSLLRTIPGEDTAPNLNAIARRYRYEIAREHF
jgi:hypothetical protein